uniref:BPTI/Kunitz inhibitor domain-containing protein n=1 Tax=Bos mutus grunniens TaxID=30521 RepID=A0A8B9XYF3_BOSMU
MKISQLCFLATHLTLLGTPVASIPGCETSNKAQYIPALCPDFCLLSPYTGPCKAKIIRSFYKARSGFLKTFVFGSCKAKNNSVKIKEVCPRHMTGGTIGKIGRLWKLERTLPS